MAKLKLRTTYPKELRSAAKSAQQGVGTVSIEFANGERMEQQGTLTVEQGQFLKWAMAMAFCQQLTSLPDLEPLIRELVDANPQKGDRLP